MKTTLLCVFRTQELEVMITFCAVVLKICFKEPSSFNRVVSEMARQRDTHPSSPLPFFLELATQARARIGSGAFSNKTQGGKRERRVSFENLPRKAPFSSLEDLCAKHLFHLTL